MNICTRCYEIKEMYHGRSCKECRQKYMAFMQKERTKKNCPICKKAHNNMTVECSIKCKILNRHKVVDGCWIWQGKLNNSGYGCFSELINEEKQELRSHRESYKIFKGEIPEGMLVCHTCDNPACCNPEHLWLGTNKENQQDSLKKGRRLNSKQRAIVAGKMTEEEVQELRELYKNGISRKELQEKFKLSQSHVTGIINYKYWAHV